MKKFSYILLAALFSVATNAQTLQVWNNHQPVFQQTVETVDSITFLSASQDNNLPTPEKLCKTWTCINKYDNEVIAELTFNEDKTYYWNWKYDNKFSPTSGTYLVQGNIIILCLNSIVDTNQPIIVAYNDGKIYANSVAYGHLIFN